VRRTRLIDSHQAALWPNWRHHAFLTDLSGDAADVDAFHRNHAVVELDIRDLKEGSGLEHVPSGSFDANSAWLQCAVLAHNLIRWSTTLGQRTPAEGRSVARTIRHRLIAVPARLVNHAGTPTLRGPARWPWGQWFGRRLAALRLLPLQPG
jgi:glycine/D-amino acid oxidase-like deaminating enzyme